MQQTATLEAASEAGTDSPELDASIKKLLLFARIENVLGGWITMGDLMDKLPFDQSARQAPSFRAGKESAQ